MTDKQTVLVLTNEDMAGILTMDECIDAVEKAFWEYGHDIAKMVPPRRTYTPLDKPGTWQWLNVIHGTVPYFNKSAIRIDAAPMRNRLINGGSRLDFPGTFTGFVLLFDLNENQLVCIYHDHYVSGIRVAATSAIGCKHLARENSKVFGIIGTGWQAEAKVEAVCAVRPIEEVKAYSTNEENRRRFAEKLNQRVNAKVRAVDNAEEAVRGSDIVGTATNAHEPVFDGRWLEEGTHVISTCGGMSFDHRKEVDTETIRRSDVVVVNIKEQIEIDQQRELLTPIKKGILDPNEILELKDLVAGKKLPFRTSSSITHHNNNSGMGIQFAAAGAVIYEKARKEGRGTELPAELFVTFRPEDDYSAP